MSTSLSAFFSFFFFFTTWAVTFSVGVRFGGGRVRGQIVSRAVKTAGADADPCGAYKGCIYQNVPLTFSLGGGVVVISMCVHSPQQSFSLCFAIFIHLRCCFLFVYFFGYVCLHKFPFKLPWPDNNRGVTANWQLQINTADFLLCLKQLWDELRNPRADFIYLLSHSFCCPRQLVPGTFLMVQTDCTPGKWPIICVKRHHQNIPVGLVYCSQS